MGRAALFVVLGSSLIMGRMLIGMNEQSNNQLEEIGKHYQGIISRNIANSAATIAVSELFRDFEWRTGLDSTHFEGGEFEVLVEEIDFDTSLAVRRVKVTAVSNYSLRADTVVVVVARPPFSSYSMFTDTWPSPPHYFITGDTLWGPMHVNNNEVGIYGSPVFMSKVSFGADSYTSPWGADPEFLGGVEFGAEAIPLPDYSTGLSALEDSANSGGEVFSNHVWIKFCSNGKYMYKYGGYPPDQGSTGGWDGQTLLSDINSVIMSDPGKDIHVKGTLSGQLTIYSGRHIYIEDDIVYDQDPRIYPNSPDMLGLVSEKDIIVVDNPANQNDCVIHAATMALDESFKVENYSSGSPRGTLITLGSIVQREKGAVGTMSGGVLQTGYYKNFQYDNRFLHVGPPVYPIAQTVMVYSWHEDASNSGYGTISEIVTN